MNTNLVTGIIAVFKSEKARERMAKGIAASFLGVALMTCSGCGGGDTPASSPSEAAAPAPAQKTILIEAYGDSTMYGAVEINNVYVQASMPAPAVLQSLLQSKFGDNVTVMNHGVPATTAADLLRGDGVNLPWVQQMAQSKAQIVFFNFGINDSRAATGQSIEAFRSNEMELVRIAKAAGKTVLVETANPVSDPVCANLPAYVNVAVSVANAWGIPVIDEYAYLSGMDWKSLMSDPQGMHPTQDGYRLKGQYEFQILAPVVQYALDH